MVVCCGGQKLIRHERWYREKEKRKKKTRTQKDLRQELTELGKKVRGRVREVSNSTHLWIVWRRFASRKRYLFAQMEMTSVVCGLQVVIGHRVVEEGGTNAVVVGSTIGSGCVRQCNNNTTEV
ncbi:hypothetical protein B296_00042686 [Ensete ventricosum]|uniref:Uncharacterized protein n=1 Tax=Ensete ventricosum TaxID=4639 RepID=A0A426Y2I2_ENSVE|nr:hypothetical protein B296_00042686 [Ensete ventricosum]